MSAGMNESAPFRHTTVLLNEAVEGVLARPGLRQRPMIGGVPALRLREHVAYARPVKDAGVAPLEPVVEPGQRFDVQALPWPRQAVVAEHRHAHVGAAREALQRGEAVRQVQRHVLPVAA